MLCSPTDLVLNPRGGSPHSSISKESDWNAVDPGSRRSPGEGNGYPLQYSSLENPMDRAAWMAIVHGVTKNQTNWVTTFIFYWVESSDNCSTFYNTQGSLANKDPNVSYAEMKKSCYILSGHMVGWYTFFLLSNCSCSLALLHLQHL